MFNLRDYQRDSVHATWQYLKLCPGSPVIVLPTGAGKSIVIAELVRRVVRSGGRAMVLNRPHPCNRKYYSETVNDLDGLVVNTRKDKTKGGHQQKRERLWSQEAEATQAEALIHTPLMW